MHTEGTKVDHVGTRGETPLILGLLLLLMAIGCDDGGGSGIQSGRFLDAAVAGLAYETDTHSGVTDEDGRFFYDRGQTITFRLGDISLGRGPAGTYMTPVDLVSDAEDETHPTVVNICRLLQSLDADGNLDNGIGLTPEILAAVEGTPIDFGWPAADFETDPDVIGLFDRLNALGCFSESGGRQLRGISETLAHFRETLARIQQWEHSDDDGGITEGGGGEGGGGNAGDGGGGTGGGDSGSGDAGGGDGGGSTGGG